MVCNPVTQFFHEDYLNKNLSGDLKRPFSFIFVVKFQKLPVVIPLTYQNTNWKNCITA